MEYFKSYGSLSCCPPFVEGAEENDKYIKNLSKEKKCSVQLADEERKFLFHEHEFNKSIDPSKGSKFQLCPCHLIFSSKVIYTWEVSNHL